VQYDFPIRKIIHIDMDAFYASVEQMDNPELRGKPVAVGGSRERGVVAAASYEARKFGIRSAMSSIVAARQCPGLIFVKPRFERYKELSHRIRDIFYRYTDLVEPLSLDEAFLDVTDNGDFPSASMLAFEIRNRIREEIGLNASAGISINKFLAKVASDINKPNGQKTIPPDQVLAFLEDLPIKKFYGVGEKTAERMRRQGIYNGRDLKSQSLEFLVSFFGKSGRHYYDIVRGIHLSRVKPDRNRKSVGAERTFSNDLIAEEYMLEQLDYIADQVQKRLEQNQTRGKTVTLKLKYSDFTQQTRSRTVNEFLGKKSEFMPVVIDLLRQEAVPKPVRLLGISFSKLDSEEEERSVSVQMKLDF
jgi:DNA polymerase IV